MLHEGRRSRVSSSRWKTVSARCRWPRAGPRRAAPGRTASSARMPGLEARVDPPRLALPRHLREPPEGGPDRQQRQEQEIDDELDLEATHDSLPHVRRCSSVGAFLPIPRSSDVVGSWGEKHEGYRSRSCSHFALGRSAGAQRPSHAIVAATRRRRAFASRRRRTSTSRPREPSSSPPTRPAAGQGRPRPPRGRTLARRHDPGDPDRAAAVQPQIAPRPARRAHGGGPATPAARASARSAARPAPRPAARPAPAPPPCRSPPCRSRRRS